MEEESDDIVRRRAMDVAGSDRPRPDRPAAPPTQPDRKIASPPMPWLRVRQTIIPPLLTLGLLLPAVAFIAMKADIDSPFHAATRVGPLALISVGAVSLLLAGMNMAALRRRR